MASLQYMLSCTTNYPRSSLSLPAFPKQSHFISRRHHHRRLRVCCQNQKDDGKSKIDRRNMLLGLGSLYGAANLISTPGQASAVPIKTPKLDKCVMGRNWNTGGEPLHAHCCLINDLEVVDYVAPPNAPWRTRKPVQELEPDKVKDFKNAIRKMKSLPPTDPHSFEQQSRIHCAYCNASYFQPDTSLDLQVHFNWLFFPFHRWYIYFFEKICGQLIGKPDFALPYWNWDHPDGMIVDPIFTDDRSPLYDNLRDWENLFGDNLSDPSPQPVSLGGASELTEAELTKAAELMKAKLKKTELTEAELRKAAELMKAEKTKENNKAVMYNEMMTEYSSPTEFMGQPYRKGSWWTKGSGGKSEMGAHNMVHYWVGTKKGPNKPPLFNNSTGEDLGNFYSAGKDPLFYCHHSNVDRMWTIWQTLPTRGDKFIKDPDFLNTQFILYDENKRLARVKVGDCINNTALRYTYSDQPTPWRDYQPPSQTPEDKARRATSKAPKVEDVLPLKDLKEIVTVVVRKTGKGAVDESLLIEEITYDKDKFVKFDVFVNDEGSETEVFSNLQKASYAGTFSRLQGSPPQDSNHWPLTDVYKKMDVADEETVLVTLVPRTTENAVTIGKISIIKNPNP